MDLDDYIISKRFIKGVPKLSLVYLNMYDIISSLIDSDQLYHKLPKLVTCYSTERTCEFVSMNGNDYIIYDQYLGQTFNMLNRIYFNSTDKFDIVSYAYKVLAEIYHSMSEIEMSQICLIAYTENKEQHETYKNEQDLGIRRQYTYFQEFFVLMHEVAHWHLSNIDKTSHICEKRHQLMEYLLYMQKVNDPDRTDAYLNDIDAVLESPYGSYKEYISNDMYKKLDISLETAHNEFLNVAMEMIKSNDDFIEECLCDDIATNFLVPLMISKYGIAIEECLQIIYLGLQNLELLTILRIEALKKEGDSSSNYLVELLLRNGHFRKVIPCLLGNFNSEGLKKCNERFTKSNRKYTKIIKDPVLFLLTNILNDLKNIDTKGNAPIIASNEEYNELIRKL